jgi:hypothetical protein
MEQLKSGRKRIPMKGKRAKASAKLPAMKKKESAGAKTVEFADFGGRRVEKVELCCSSEYHSITIRFDDNTDLCFVIDARFTFTFKADYLAWKEGNQRLLKSWPMVRSVGA